MEGSGDGWIRARFGRLLAVDAVAAGLGAVLLLALRLVPQLLSPLAFGILLAALLAAVAVDLLRWAARGVRAARLDNDALTLLRGPGREPRRLERPAVRAARVRGGWAGRRIEIALAGRPRRLVLRDEAFDRSDFDRLAAGLGSWGSGDGGR